MSARVFIPKSVRGTLAQLSPAERVEAETHLENLSSLANAPSYFTAFAALPQVDGRYVTAPAGRLTLHFTIDPITRVLYVHRVELGSART